MNSNQLHKLIGCVPIPKVKISGMSLTEKLVRILVRVSTNKGFDDGNHLKQLNKIREAAIKTYGVAPEQIQLLLYADGYQATSMEPLETLMLLQSLPDNCYLAFTDATRLARIAFYSLAEVKALELELANCITRGITFVMHTVKNEDVRIDPLLVSWYEVQPHYLLKLMDGYDPAKVIEKRENFKKAHDKSIKVRSAKVTKEASTLATWYNKWEPKHKDFKQRIMTKFKWSDSAYRNRYSEAKSRFLLNQPTAQ